MMREGTGKRRLFIRELERPGDASVLFQPIEGEQVGGGLNTTLAVGEEGGYLTRAVGEGGIIPILPIKPSSIVAEGGYTTMAVGEEGGTPFSPVVY